MSDPSVGKVVRSAVEEAYDASVALTTAGVHGVESRCDL